MRILEQVAWLVDGGKRQLQALESLRERLCRPLTQNLRNLWNDPRALIDSTLIGRELRIGQPALAPEGSTKGFPMLLANDRDEQLGPILGLKKIVHGPGSILDREGDRRRTGNCLEHHRLSHQEDVILEQRTLDVAAAARALPFREGSLNGDDA